ncbi:Cationic amino acid transporter 2, partial [Fragariocoptes setiger]
MHLVHIKKGLDKERISIEPDSVAVIAVLVESNRKSNANFNPIVNTLISLNMSDTPAQIEFNTIYDLMPQNLQNFYTYQGSLTTPPCYEVVNWIVMQQRIYINAKQMELFRNLYARSGHDDGGEQAHQIMPNFRQTQNSSGRVIMASFSPSTLNEVASATTTPCASWLVVLFVFGQFALLRVNNNNNNKSRQANNNNKPHWFWSIYYLPKRWFSHFYLIAFGSFSLALAYALFQYTDTSFKRRYSHLLNLNYVFAKLTHERIKDVHTVTSNIFAIMLMLFQVTRRLYECLFVSVFSDSGKINILHYTFGCSFYVFAALSLVCPITVEPNPDITIQLILANLVTIGRSLAFIVFVYASLVQHKCHIILANLRKDKSGRVITDQHFVPSGYLFEFITCPHFLAEISSNFPKRREKGNEVAMITRIANKIQPVTHANPPIHPILSIMDHTRLTQGAIKQMLTQPIGSVINPVVQILAHKPVEPGTLERDNEISSGKPRIRLMINDGQDCHQYCIIANEDLVNDINSGNIDKFSVIRIVNYSTSPFKQDSKLIIIINADLVCRGAEIGCKIGDAPTSNRGVDQRARYQAPAQQSPAAPAQRAPVIPPQRAPVVPAQHAPMVPTQQATVVPIRQAPMVAPSARSNLADQYYLDISTLSPYSSKWAIRGRVVIKQDMRYYSNAKGEGKLFAFVVADKTGEIKMTCFNNEADKFYPLIQQGRVYSIKGGKIAAANKRYTSAEYECTLGQETIIEECHDNNALAEMPTIRYNFIRIENIATRDVETPIDVIGVILNVGEPGTVISKTRNKELKKRNITIVDDSRHDISVTIWGEASETFTAQQGDVFASKGARIGVYGGRSLSAGDHIAINPDIPETRKLKNWFSSHVDNNYKHLTIDGEASVTSEWRDIMTINDLDYVRSVEKYLLSKVKATIMSVGQKPLYKCCPSEQCKNKKLEDMPNAGGMRCANCQQTHTVAKMRYNLSINIGDGSGDTWTTLWDQTAENLIGYKAEDLFKIMEEDKDKDKYGKVMEQPTFKTYIFTIRSKLDNWDGKERIRHTVASIAALDYAAHANKLIADIRAIAIKMSGLNSKFKRFVWMLSRRKPMDTTEEAPTDLNRCLDTLSLTALGVGSTLGFGLYVLSAKVPKSGSAYAYSYITFVAFIIGWNLTLEHVIGTASLARGYSGYLGSLFASIPVAGLNDTLIVHPAAPAPNWAPEFMQSYVTNFDALAFGLTMLVTGLLLLGVQVSSKFQMTFASLNLSVALFIFICGCFKANFHNWNLSTAEIPASAGAGGFMPFGFTGVIAGAGTCFFAFVGFDGIASAAEETKNPRKAIPNSILWTSGIIFITYCAMSTIQTLIWPYWDQKKSAPLPYIFEQLQMPYAKWTVLVGVLAGLSTSFVGGFLPLPRILYAMARDGVIYRVLSIVSKRFKVPVVATIVGGILIACLASLLEIDQLADMLSIGTLAAYSLVSISVLLLRYEHQQPTNCDAPLPLYKTDALPDRNRQSTIANNGNGNGNDNNGKTASNNLASIANTVVPFANVTNGVCDKKTATAGQQSALANQRQQQSNGNQLALPTTLNDSVSDISVSAFTECTTNKDQTSIGSRSSVSLLSLFLERRQYEPNEQTTHVSRVIILLLVVTTTALDAALVAWGPTLYELNWMPISVITMLTGATFVLCFLLDRLPMSPKSTNSFEVPWVPTIPVFSVVINTYLMLNLSVMTWIRFAVWMAIGFFIYFTYGIFKSTGYKDAHCH